MPDAADTLSPLPNKCVGDADGPPAGDGLFNSDDLICLWWTARADLATAGTFTLSRPLPESCTWQFRSGTVSFGRIRFAGSPFDIEPGAGVEARVTVRAGDPSSPRNRARIEGEHDDSYPGWSVFASPDCVPGGPRPCCGSLARRTHLVSVPYHTLYETSSELLCGLADVDWVDADGDGRPDSCWDDANGDRVFSPGEQPTGIFDGRSLAWVAYAHNHPEWEGELEHGATIALGQLRFHGAPFDLVPGDAYTITAWKTHQTTLFFPAVP